MDIGDVLVSKSINEVEIEISPEYEGICKDWLEKCGCSMKPMREGFYLIGFPEGTKEETRCGQSGLYARRTHIVLPSKVEMPLYVFSPVNETQRVRITMGFPNEIFP